MHQIIPLKIQLEGIIITHKKLFIIYNINVCHFMLLLIMLLANGVFSLLGFRNSIPIR